MKKLFLFPVLGLLIAACTANDSSFGDEHAETPVESRYLSVNIISAGADTRAGSETEQEGNSGPGYEDGKGAENAVRQVRFYFFTESGDAAEVKFLPSTDTGEGTYLSYFDWYLTPEESEGTADSGNNIEKRLHAKIVIEAGQKDKMPFSIAAVLNPSDRYENEAGSQNLSFDEFDAIVRKCPVNDLSQAADANGKFEMSNSVYVDQEGVVTKVLPVAGHIYETEVGALADPIDIHVERVMARLDLSVSMQALDGHPGVYDTGISFSKNDGYDAGDKPESAGTDEKICVKFLGWNITAAPERSRLMKRVNREWDDRLFGRIDEPWNNYLRFRSHWAVNPDDAGFVYGNFGQDLDGRKYDPADPCAANANTYFGTAGNKATVYLQENAAADDKGMQEPYDHTKVIIAAQLVLSDGETPLTLAEWGLNYYTLDGIKAIFADNLDLYRRTGEEGSYQFAKIKPEDIDFVTAGACYPPLLAPAGNGGAPENVSEDHKGRCYVYPRLKVKDSSTWTQGEGDDALLLGSYEEADEIVRRMGRVKIWNNGYTYYYFDIAHLGGEGFPGEYGVVRNHVYDAEITALSGLGTPVYDPHETIYPEKPDHDDSMIAARINILRWRLVKKTFQVSW